MRKFLLKLLMGASLTASAFIFQACYGTPIPEVDVPRNQTQLQSVVPEDPQTPSEEEETLEEKDAETLD
ncbi:MAG: hypothetical protein IJK32_04545 [Bacteroidales bacterium]|nr:hypothetical protein [Bacteroidales bacterium]